MATVPGSVVAVQPFADAVSSEHGSCLVGRGVRKATGPEPVAAGTSVRVRAARKSEPAGAAAAAARPSQQLSIRSSLGQRGGVVKKSDGFDVFYGLVGDQPGYNAGTATPVPPPATAQPTAVDSGAAQKPSMRPVLGKRGGVVRKSDAFEVFYGLVGDQPSGAVPGNQAKDGLRSVPEVSKQDAPANLQEANGDVLETAKTEAKEKEGEQEGTFCVSPTKQAPNIAEFSLATPAASFSPGPGGPHVLDAQFAESKLAGELSKCLSAGSPKSPLLEFSLATPAASFSPTKRPAPQKDYYEDPETDYCEDLGDLPDHLNAIGERPVEQHLGSLQARLNAVANAPAEFSLATPAASLAPCQAIPELDISNVAARVPAPSGRSAQTGSGHGAGLWSISAAGFPDFFSASSLQSRLEGLDGAIAKLRALNA